MNATFPMLLVSIVAAGFAPRSAAQEASRPRIGSRRLVDVSVEGLVETGRQTSASSRVAFSASPTGSLGDQDCVARIADQATGACVQASSTPTFGSLLPYPGMDNSFVPSAFVGGGENNRALRSWSTVGGGVNNTAYGYYFSVFYPDGGYATVAGGSGNYANGAWSTIGGGADNTTISYETTIAGGSDNTARSPGSTVGGGRNNTASGNSSTVAGGSLNYALSGRTTIGGGFINYASGRAATVGGGRENTASGDYATVGGGRDGTASGKNATVGGGMLNTASGGYSTVAGGRNATASGYYATVAGGYNNGASGDRATVVGGGGNTASGSFASVAGGGANSAGGDFSFAAGRRAKANHRGSFVWGDSTNNAPGPSLKTSSAADQFNVYCSGGARMFTNSAATTGVLLAAGGSTWTMVSDRNAKENVEPVDARAVLDKVSHLPLATWNYKDQPDSIRHMGPMAQDFYAAFGLGLGDKSIDTIDPNGVALAAIQGLNELVREKDAQIAHLQAQVAALQDQVGALVAAHETR